MTGGSIKGMINDALERLGDQLDAGMSDGLKRYLAAMARFHRYSAGNLLLILSQRPDATHVAGYGTWKSLGRQVRRGEKGILILAPIVRRDKQTGENQSRREGDTIVAFRTAHVFDISQTDGCELPRPSCVDGDPEDYLEKLEEFVLDRGIRMQYSDRLGGAEGISTGGQVTILASLSAAERFATLAHELAHEMLHWKNGEARSRVIRETEAEAVAFVVCQAIGLEVGTASSDYIQLYNGDRNRLLDSLQRIQHASAEIIEGLQKTAMRDHRFEAMKTGRMRAA